jgi:hypothetical protein
VFALTFLSPHYKYLINRLKKIAQQQTLKKPPPSTTCTIITPGRMENEQPYRTFALNTPEYPIILSQRDQSNEVLSLLFAALDLTFYFRNQDDHDQNTTIASFGPYNGFCPAA